MGGCKVPWMKSNMNMRIPYSALVLQPSHRYAPKNRRCYCLLRRRSPGFDLKPKNYTSSVQFVSFLRAEVYFAEETQNSTLKIYAHLFFRGSVEETTTFNRFGSTKKERENGQYYTHILLQTENSTEETWLFVAVVSINHQR